jgi:transcriptional regulator with XRE-family HTH domain
MALEVPPKGWIKAIRESLGMTARQLGARMGVAPSRVVKIQRDEVTGATTLKNAASGGRRHELQALLRFRTGLVAERDSARTRGAKGIPSIGYRR